MRFVSVASLLFVAACRTSAEPASDVGVTRHTAPSTTTESDRWGLVRTLSSDELAGRKPGTHAAVRTRTLIRTALEGCNYEVSEQKTSGPGINLIAVQRDVPQRSRRVLVSAHYDHLGIIDGEVMNGADDNAAAVGSVIELACRISKIETSATTSNTPEAPAAQSATRHASLVVAFWDTEEPPYFMTPDMGSAFFVANPTIPLDNIDVSIVLDLVGHGLWPGFPAHIALGAETSSALETAVSTTPSPPGLDTVQASLHLVEAIVAMGANGHRQSWSDYHAFRANRVPVLFLSNGQGHHYHRPTDDFDTLDLKKLGLQTDWLVALVDRLLTNPTRPRFEDRDERPEIDLAAAQHLVQGALAHIETNGPGTERFDRAPLAADFERLRTDTSTVSLRRAVQRVQCYAAASYPKAACANL